MNTSLNTQPPPLPEPSRKRILPAFLLCLIFCAHRLYAGKYLTGLLQIGWAIGAFAWLELTGGELLRMAQSGLNLDTIDRVSDWEQVHGVPYQPMLALIAVGIWVAADAGLLVAGKFTDGAGKKITRWM